MKDNHIPDVYDADATRPEPVSTGTSHKETPGFTSSKDIPDIFKRDEEVLAEHPGLSEADDELEKRWSADRDAARAEGHPVPPLQDAYDPRATASQNGHINSAFPVSGDDPAAAPASDSVQLERDIAEGRQI